MINIFKSILCVPTLGRLVYLVYYMMKIIWAITSSKQQNIISQKLFTCVTGLVFVVNIPVKPFLSASFKISLSINCITATFSLAVSEECVASMNVCKILPFPAGRWVSLKYKNIFLRGSNFAISIIVVFEILVTIPRLRKQTNLKLLFWQDQYNCWVLWYFLQ